MLVHLASGTHPFPSPWVNVDLNEHEGVNEIVDLLSDDWGSVKNVEIAYVGHWLEHMTNEEAYTFLYKLKSVMIPGGVAVFVGPDVVRARVLHGRGMIPQSLLDACLPHGEADGHNRAACHLSQTTESSVHQMLDDAGWAGTHTPKWSTLPLLDIPVIDRSEWQYVLMAAARGDAS